MNRMEQTVSTITADDQESFRAFYTREFVAMVSLASSVAGDMSVAEDLAQEAFHKARSTLAQLLGETNIAESSQRVTAERRKD